MASQKLTFFFGTILNPQSDIKCDLIRDGMLVVKGKKIVDLLEKSKGLKKYAKSMKPANTKDFGQALILPGFYDMHFHWVQDDVREMPKDLLLDWLEKYTFPSEAKFADQNYATEKARRFFKRLSRVGTLGGACYSSIHEAALHAAMKEVKGDFIIGNVLMNMNSPKNLSQEEDAALSLTKALIRAYGDRHVFTPRFAITTSPRVMKEGSRLADKAKCFKQTHLSENHKEIEFVLSLYKALPGFEEVKSYTEIYEKTGMLGKRSLMGHGIHLSPKELKTLSRTKTAIVHCPTSNAPIEEKGLGSGLFDFKKVERYDVRWALGSDIGGGPYLSMLDVMRSFVSQNAHRKGATYVKALYRSTLAGARILGHGKTTGNLNKGKFANFIVIPDNPTSKSPEKILKALVEAHSSDRAKYDELVSHVYLQGLAVS